MRPNNFAAALATAAALLLVASSTPSLAADTSAPNVSQFGRQSAYNTGTLDGAKVEITPHNFNADAACVIESMMMKNTAGYDQHIEIGALKCPNNADGTPGGIDFGECHNNDLFIEFYRANQSPAYSCIPVGTFSTGNTYTAVVKRYCQTCTTMYGWIDNSTHYSIDGFPDDNPDAVYSRTWIEGSKGSDISCSDFGPANVDFDHWQKFFYSSGSWQAIYTTEKPYAWGASCTDWSLSSIDSTGSYNVHKG